MEIRSDWTVASAILFLFVFGAVVVALFNKYRRPKPKPNPNVVNTDDHGYDVFVSFNAIDISKGVIDHLYSTLLDAGVRVFQEDEAEELPIREEFDQGMRESKICIPIFSKNYASDRWCIGELVLMYNLMKEGNHIILPVFYDVTPSEVQMETYCPARVPLWRGALSEIGRLEGVDLVKLANGNETQLINLVTLKVLKLLRDTASNPVGLDSHIRVLEELVRRHAEEEDLARRCAEEEELARRRAEEDLAHRRAEEEELTRKRAEEEIARGYDVFLNFSRNTSRDFTRPLYDALIDAGVHVFPVYQTTLKYSKELVLQALRKSKICIPIFSEHYASTKWCLSKLALMYELMKEEGNHMILPVFYDVTPSDVQMQTGFIGRALQHLERDLATRNSGFDPVIVQLWREALSGVGSLEGMDLVKLANGDHGQLVKLVTSKVLKLLRDPASNLVSTNLVGLDSRLGTIMEKLDFDANDELGWHGDGEFHIPQSLGVKNLVVLDLSKSTVKESWTGWSLLKEAKNLEVLYLTGCQHLKKTPEFSSFPRIRRLIFRDCIHLEMIHPSVGDLTNLISFDVRNCQRLKSLPIKLGSLEQLHELLLDESSIEEIPDLSGLKNLEIFSAKSCKLLRRVPESVGSLVKLRKLLLDNCESLVDISETIGQLELLQELSLSHTRVMDLPDPVEKWSNLEVLNMDHCPISRLPSSLGNLPNIEVMNFSGCLNLKGEFPFALEHLTTLRVLKLDHTNISNLPTTIGKLSHLHTLDLEGCMKLQSLPMLPVSLVNLKVAVKSSVAVPNLTELINLKHIELQHHSSSSISKKKKKEKRHSSSIISEDPKDQATPSSDHVQPEYEHEVFLSPNVPGNAYPNVSGYAYPNVPGYAYPNVPGYAYPNVPGNAYPNVPGYGFYPTDEEFVGYLKQRVLEHIQGYPNSMSDYFPDIDLFQSKPSDLPHLIEGSTMGGYNRYEWYFFGPRKEKRSGTNRTVPDVGYWKVTGRKQDIVSGTTGRVIGTKSILVFQQSGRGSSSSQENDWVVHEYHLLPSYLGHMNIKEMPFVACCLKKKA